MKTVTLNKTEAEMVKFMLEKCEDWLYDYWTHEEADGLYEKFEEEKC